MRGRSRGVAPLVAMVALLAAACGAPAGLPGPVVTITTTVTPTADSGAGVPAAGSDADGSTGVVGAGVVGAGSAVDANGSSAAGSTAPSFTFAFAGDVHFEERVADRLADDPATVFGVAAPGLAAADLTMVNLETAIATGGDPEPKSFTFRAPPSAITALADAGIDLASMANNHGADYGAQGLRESLYYIGESGFPVIGIGGNDAHAFAPYTTVINGLSVAVFAATQVHDHTLAYFSAGPESAGVANADSDLLVSGVTAAAAKFDVVVVFLHWGTEYQQCPNGDQERLADTLAAAGATAVIGTHAHVLQGAGWRPDGVYVAYGLSNFLWWRSFGNNQDDNGVLTLTFESHHVVAADFAPAHLDDTGVPVPARGTELARIQQQWDQARGCTDLAASPPAG